MDFHANWNLNNFQYLSIKFNFLSNLTIITAPLHDDVCTFMILRAEFFVELEMLKSKTERLYEVIWK